jgi:hypothetical protein
MNQSLNLIQDLEFTEASESAATIVGGLSIACLHDELAKGGHISWGGCFPQPRSPVHPVRPIHPPIDSHPRPFPLPRPLPHPWTPKHPPRYIATAEVTM